MAVLVLWQWHYSTRRVQYPSISPNPGRRVPEVSESELEVMPHIPLDVRGHSSERNTIGIHGFRGQSEVSICVNAVRDLRDLRVGDGRVTAPALRRRTNRKQIGHEQTLPQPNYVPVLRSFASRFARIGQLRHPFFCYLVLLYPTPTNVDKRCSFVLLDEMDGHHSDRSESYWFGPVFATRRLKLGG